ncbi:MAG: class I SAM-dependent methyltransferase [Gammaproteobacteria bacterium]|nr:class I SAM-dependent methyltransferase [Gammaproteobacteria bacterium]
MSSVAVFPSRLLRPVRERLLTVPQLGAVRHRLLEPITGHVLEPGIGRGHNLTYYPDSITSLTGVDIRGGDLAYARERSRLTRFPVDLRPLDDAATLPMKDATFDCVVCTFALSFMPGAGAMLAEIVRVLRPGGRFFFAEPVLSVEKPVAQRQTRWAPAVRRLFGGLDVTRDITFISGVADFELTRLQQFYVERLPKIVGHIAEGVAVKKDADAL